jgi:DNA-binding XRE family transcriptional regulator
MARRAYIEDYNMDRLSNRIREFRFRTGETTQKELAERVGISRQTMNAIEISDMRRRWR